MDKISMSDSSITDSTSVDINLSSCMARKQDGCQCTRNRRTGSDYCGKHITKRKWGRVDEHLHLSSDDIITEPIEIMGKLYYKDIKNVLFEKIGDNFTIIGKFKDGTIKLLSDSIDILPIELDPIINDTSSDSTIELSSSKINLF
jgi:hypothetical protein